MAATQRNRIPPNIHATKGSPLNYNSIAKTHMKIGIVERGKPFGSPILWHSDLPQKYDEAVPSTLAFQPLDRGCDNSSHLRPGRNYGAFVDRPAAYRTVSTTKATQERLDATVPVVYPGGHPTV